MSFIDKLNKVIETTHTHTHTLGGGEYRENIEKWLLIKMEKSKPTRDGEGFFITIDDLYSDNDFPLKTLSGDMQKVIDIVNTISPNIAGLVKWDEGSGMEYGNGQYVMIIYYYPNATESKIQQLKNVKKNVVE
jgi:hypothetical protein